MSQTSSARAGAVPHFSVTAVELFERDVRLRMPFRFGVVAGTAGSAAEQAQRRRGSPRWPQGQGFMAATSMKAAG